MTPKSLFIIILKVFALFLIKDILMFVPQMFPVITMMNPNDNLSMFLGPLITAIALFIIYIILIWLLLFKPAAIIRSLGLEKGFEQDRMTININSGAILTVAIFVISGLVLINEIPELVKQVLNYYQQKRYLGGISNPPISNIVISLVKIISVLLLLCFRSSIVRLIHSNTNKEL